MVASVTQIPMRSALAKLIMIGTCAKKVRLLVMIQAFLQCRARNLMKGPGRPYALHGEKRACFWNVVKPLTGLRFRKTFRLTCYQLRTLVARLRPKRDHNRVMASRASGLLQAEIKTAVLLRFLSGGNHHDLCLLFNLQSSSLYDIFRRTLSTLLSSFELPGIPEDVDKLKKMALDF